MNILHLLKDPPIQIILTVFFCSFGYTVKSYIKVYKQLNLLNKGLEPFEKDNISYKFEEFKHVMTTNPLATKPWEDFKSTLVFSDIKTATQKNLIMTAFLIQCQISKQQAMHWIISTRIH